MWQPHFMSRCSHDMTVTRHCLYLCLAQLIIILLIPCDVNCSALSRHKSKLVSAKTPVEDTTETSNAVPDQIALATNNNQRRKDYGYGSFELNLVRPEKEPRLHAQITTKYSTSIVSDHVPTSSLEDAQTAEEYVSKAMQQYGSRLKEPIRIEPEPDTGSAGNLNEETGNYRIPDAYSSTEQPNEPHQQQEFASHQPFLEENRSELDIQAQSQLKQQEQQEQFEYFQSQQAQEVNPNEQQNAERYSEQAAPVPAYRLYDEEVNYENAQPIDRTYRTKHVYQTNYQNSDNEPNSNSEKIRVSASTEIPKAEIMKQIEKSVIKYMQELEAEGKIITAPKEPKTYYKVVTVPVENKRASTTTTRPKYINSGGTGASSPSPYANEKTIRYHTPKSSYKEQAHAENGGSYDSSGHSQYQETSDSHDPNVEFVYKIKSRAPLQTATVKTISKPYSLSLKNAPDQFDHSSVLKNIEEFDLRHVVTTKDFEEQNPATSRPSKLYFNSEVHQDINSLPYKGDKTRLVATEYQRLKEPPLQGDYKGYSGYFAEPAPVQTEKEVYSNSNLDDGYPIRNPYPYVLKKEHSPAQFEDVSTSANWDQPRIHGKPLFSVTAGQKAHEYEGYSSKYNTNNQDSYGYVHAYKSERDRDREAGHGIHKHVQRHVLGKRGKRGGTHQSNSSKKSGLRSTSKDAGTGFALRPPPKV